MFSMFVSSIMYVQTRDRQLDNCNRLNRAECQLLPHMLHTIALMDYMLTGFGFFLFLFLFVAPLIVSAAAAALGTGLVM